MITWLVSISFIGFMIFYAYYQSRLIIAGPEIILFSPENDIVATSSLIEIRGQARRAKELTLDGRAIFVDLSGNFNEKLLLSYGYNIIELVAKDAKGHEVRKLLELVSNESTTSAGVIRAPYRPVHATTTESVI